MLKLGEVLSEEEVNELLAEADVNGDGKFDYQEFVSTMMSSIGGGGRQEPNPACSSETILTEVKSTNMAHFHPMATDTEQSVSEASKIMHNETLSNNKKKDEETQKNPTHLGEVLFKLKL